MRFDLLNYPVCSLSFNLHLFIYCSFTDSISGSVFVLNLGRFDISGMLLLIISDLISLRLFVAMFQYFSSCFITIKSQQLMCFIL